MSKLSIHISGNPEGLDPLLLTCAQANSPIPVIYSLNQNIADSIRRNSPETKWIYRRQSDRAFPRLPQDMWHGNPEQSATDWLTVIRDPDDQHRTQVENWGLNPANWYDPLNEPAIEIADPNNPDQVVDAVRKAQWLNTWMDTALTIADRLHLKLALFSFPTGSPPLVTWKEVNTSKLEQVPPNPECQAVVWHYLLPALRHGKRSGAVLSLHAYWEEREPSVDSRDALRYRDLMRVLPADARLPIVISEASSGNGYGISQTKGKGRPWVDDMARWDTELMKDPIILAGCAFQVGRKVESEIPTDVLAKYGDYISKHPTPNGLAPSELTPIEPLHPTVFSPDDTLVPPSDNIIDGSGRVWSLGENDAVGRRILQGGAQFANGQGVLLLFHDHKVFTSNSRNEWFVITATGFEPAPGDPRAQPAADSQVRSMVSPMAALNPTDTPLSPAVPAWRGLHMCADGNSPDRDFECLTDANLDAAKIMTNTSFEEYARLRKMLRQPERIVLRLFAAGDNPSLGDAKKFFDEQSMWLREFDKNGGRYIEIHNEPNLQLEGFGRFWQTPQAFGDWYRDVALRIRTAFPALLLGWPGLSPQDNAPAFMPVLDACIQAGLVDWIGAHSYWVNEAGLKSEDANGQLRQDDARYYRRFLNKGKPVLITEFANVGTADSDELKGQQYREYYNSLDSGVLAAFAFVSSASNDEFNQVRQTWVRNGVKAAISRLVHG